MKRSRNRTISFNSSIPEKSAKREVKLSNQETMAYSRKAEIDRKRQESVFTRRDVQFVRGPDLQMEKRFSKTETRKREGLAPVSNPPTKEQLDSSIWFNWRSPRQNRRAPISEAKRNTLLCDFLRIDRMIIRSLSDHIQSELYAIVVMLLFHGKFIRVPGYLGRSYQNPAHSVQGALDRLRWMTPALVKEFGS